MKGQNNGTCRVPNYAVLNYCRILAYLAEGLVASKKEGGEWGIQNLPKTYQTLIQEALKEYAKKNSSELVDAGLLKQFTQYAQDKIEVAVNNLNQ
jgi:streptomycin 3"-adenylyltransferase